MAGFFYREDFFLYIPSCLVDTHTWQIGKGEDKSLKADGLYRHDAL